MDSGYWLVKTVGKKRGFATETQRTRIERVLGVNPSGKSAVPAQTRDFLGMPTQPAAAGRAKLCRPTRWDWNSKLSQRERQVPPLRRRNGGSGRDDEQEEDRRGNRGPSTAALRASA